MIIIRKIRNTMATWQSFVSARELFSRHFSITFSANFSCQIVPNFTDRRREMLLEAPFLSCRRIWWKKAFEIFFLGVIDAAAQSSIGWARRAYYDDARYSPGARHCYCSQATPRPVMATAERDRGRQLDAGGFAERGEWLGDGCTSRKIRDISAYNIFLPRRRYLGQPATATIERIRWCWTLSMIQYILFNTYAIALRYDFHFKSIAYGVLSSRFSACFSSPLVCWY